VAQCRDVGATFVDSHPANLGSKKAPMSTNEFDIRNIRLLLVED